VQVLAGVIQVDDLSGLGELGGGDVPDPGCAVADDGELADVLGAAADAVTEAWLSPASNADGPGHPMYRRPGPLAGRKSGVRD
jgi:hypothetical protein